MTTKRRDSSITLVTPLCQTISLKDGSRTGSFAPSPFSEFALIRPYAKSHNASRSVNAAAAPSLDFCMTWRTFMEFHCAADLVTCHAPLEAHNARGSMPDQPLLDVYCLWIETDLRARRSS